MEIKDIHGKVIHYHQGDLIGACFEDLGPN